VTACTIPIGTAGRLQDQRLLDMELKVGGDVPRFKHVVRLRPAAFSPLDLGLEVPDAARVLHLSQSFQSEHTDHRL